MTKRELTFIELLVIIAIVTVLAVIVLSALARARGDARRSSCQNNLKQMWLVCEMYANETGGAYPAIKARDCDGSVHKQFCINSFALYPKYMTDPAILLCPTAPSNKGLGDSFTEVTTAKYTPTGVWNGTAFEPLPAEADHLFFPCEVSVTTCNYFYLGWALYVPGITDDPHSFTSTNSTALIADKFEF